MLKESEEFSSEGKTQGKHVLSWVGIKKQTHPLEGKTELG